MTRTFESHISDLRRYHIMRVIHEFGCPYGANSNFVVCSLVRACRV